MNERVGNDHEKLSHIVTDTTPYSRSDEEIVQLTHELIATDAYMDKSTNPAIGDFAVYQVESANPLADIGRTLEARIFKHDAGYEASFIEGSFAPYDNNSIFMLLLDTSDKLPKPVGALRIIDCKRGGSETVSMFEEFHGQNLPLPSDLAVEGEPVWDILSIVMDPEFRNGVNSAWLYHGLFKAALQNKTERFIANVTPKEMHNLRALIGVPFKDIQGAPEIEDTDPITGQSSKYGFYVLDVNNIHPALAARIEKLESNQGAMNQMLAKIARIAFLGRAQEQ